MYTWQSCCCQGHFAEARKELLAESAGFRFVVGQARISSFEHKENRAVGNQAKLLDFGTSLLMYSSQVKATQTAQCPLLAFAVQVCLPFWLPFCRSLPGPDLQRQTLPSI